MLFILVYFFCSTFVIASYLWLADLFLQLSWHYQHSILFGPIDTNLCDFCLSKSRDRLNFQRDNNDTIIIIQMKRQWIHRKQEKSILCEDGNNDRTEIISYIVELSSICNMMNRNRFKSYWIDMDELTIEVLFSIVRLILPANQSESVKNVPKILI